MISYITLNINTKVLFVFCMLVLFAFFIVMDVHLYFTLQATTLVDAKPPADGHFSPFQPLTVKLLMTDPFNHYILTTSAEYFDEITSFSKVFFFITPNMISFTHLTISFISAKLVSSENLSTRRYGVLLYQLRSWLDDLDGVVYRSHTKTKGKYQSNHNTLGYYIDIYSDIIGGTALCFGILFFLWKTLPLNTYSQLPVTKSVENGSSSPVPNSSPSRKFLFNANVLNMMLPGSEKSSNGGYSKQFIFFKVLCFGLLMGVAASTWDRVVLQYEELLEVDLKNADLTKIQTEDLHSGSFWLVVYLWRIWEGQALLQMLLLAVFIDKTWEFLCFFQYLGYVILIFVNVVSVIHKNQVKGRLGL